MNIWLVRAFLLVVVLLSVCYVHPFGEDSFNLVLAVVFGAVFGILVILAEFWIRKLETKALLGAAVGAIAGAVGANMISLVIARMSIAPQTMAALHILILIAMIYLGLVCGVYGGSRFKWAPSNGIFSEDSTHKTNKILDTSVIIDGRVADICKTGFLEGALIVPHFVLRELQQIADSADSAKRNRGRRGLDVL
jgi:uncharacterized protein YacL